jgi:hypothetical protein
MVSISGTPPISFVDNIETYDAIFFFVIDGGSKNASILELDAIWGLLFHSFKLIMLCGILITELKLLGIFFYCA